MKKEEVKKIIAKAQAMLECPATFKASERSEMAKLLDDLSRSRELPAWLVIVLKVLAYALGLILAGVGTATAASCVFHI